MIQVECVTAALPTDVATAVNTQVQSLVASKYEILNVYPITVGDARYVSAMIVYNTTPATNTYVTQEALSNTLSSYAKKTEIPTIPTVPTKVSQLENDAGYITQSVADTLYEHKTTGG